MEELRKGEDGVSQCDPSDGSGNASVRVSGKSPLMTRRQVAVGVAGVAALAIVGGAGRAFASEQVLLRPPGGQDEERLLGACIRCDRCRSICPTNAIDVATVEDGLINVRTPKMNFRIGGCDACEGAYLCARVCPAGALLPFDPATEKLGLAVIDFDRCESYGTSARCKYECIDLCPAEALYRDEGDRLALNKDVCWGCGICEYVCPSNSYRAYSGSKLRGINIEPWEG